MNSANFEKHVVPAVFLQDYDTTSKSKRGSKTYVRMTQFVVALNLVIIWTFHRNNNVNGLQNRLLREHGLVSI